MRKIKHFDRLKPCSGTILSSSTQPQLHQEDTTTQPDNHRSITHAFGNHTELIDEADDDEAAAAPSQITGHVPPVIPVRRYPTREQRPPRRLGDYVSH